MLAARALDPSSRGLLRRPDGVAAAGAASAGPWRQAGSAAVLAHPMRQPCSGMAPMQGRATSCRPGLLLTCRAILTVRGGTASKPVSSQPQQASIITADSPVEEVVEAACRALKRGMGPKEQDLVRRCWQKHAEHGCPAHAFRRAGPGCLTLPLPPHVTLPCPSPLPVILVCMLLHAAGTHALHVTRGWEQACAQGNTRVALPVWSRECRWPSCRTISMRWLQILQTLGR